MREITHGDGYEAERLDGLGVGHTLTEQDVKDIKNLLSDYNDEIERTVEQLTEYANSVLRDIGGDEFVEAFRQYGSRLSQTVVESVLAKMRDRWFLETGNVLKYGSRGARQPIVQEWAIEAFGRDESTSPAQRALRFLEEAIELYQAANARRDISVAVSPNNAKEQAHRLVDYVFNRAVGNVEQEFGGVGVTLLALAASLCVDADLCEKNEIAHCLSRDPSEMSQRNREKNEAGFKA